MKTGKAYSKFGYDFGDDDGGEELVERLFGIVS